MAEKTADKSVKETKETKEKAVKIDIIRGRMPLPIVAMIKFGDKELTDGALAAKFRTTNGKISDIRKNRNFGYIGEEYTPSQDQLDKAKEYAAQLEDKSVLAKLEGMKPASDEENAAFEAKRKASRPSKAKVEKAEEVAEAEVTDEELDSLTE